MVLLNVRMEIFYNTYNRHTPYRHREEIELLKMCGNVLLVTL